jgi:hypothetical protein
MKGLPHLTIFGVAAAAAYALAAESLFVESAASTGLAFTHTNGATGQFYAAEQMGSGAALFDYDNDGDLDVFLVDGGTLVPDKTPDVHPAGKLFRNDLERDGGKTILRFTDVTGRAGIVWRQYGMGTAVGDYDNDGDLDLFLTAFGPDALFRNNGDGTFSDVTAQAGVSDPLWSTSAAFFDYDRDGDLDLFVANYLDFTMADNHICADGVGARDYCSPRSYRPLPARLYRNEGDGRFADVTQAAGIQKAYGAGLGVAVGDYNGDGRLDIYVANDATPNQLWINRGDGTFGDEGLLSGTAVNAAGSPEGSMGIASGDVDRDGDEDLFVTNIKGTFEDARTRWGIAAPTAAFTGFGTDWIDYDNDGWLDLFVANGAVNALEALRGQPNPFRMRNQLFRNTGGQFMEASSDGGPSFERAEVGRAAAFGDLDNDGDTDILVTSNGGPVRLLVNQAAAGRHWLEVRLQQPAGNRFALGARVGVQRGGQPTLWRRVKTDGSYLSANDVRAHFGLGSSSAIGAITVEWPDGVRERWTAPLADRLVTLSRGQGHRP